MKLLAVLLLLGTAPSIAADLSFEIRTNAGKPVRNAVVMLYPAGRAVPVRPAGRYEVLQRDIKFDPFVLVVPVGADVAFPNRDTIRHQVYSFSRAKTFELKLYARDQTHVVRFDKPGIVDLGCNIHDSMTAYIAVTDTALAVKTGADGVARFRDAPEGAVSARIWHPYLRAPAGIATRELALTSAPHSERILVSLRTPPTMLDNY